MRTTPYPVPPSRAWTSTAALTYGALALAGGIVLLVVVTSRPPIPGEGVLTLWGGVTLPAALACAWGVTRDRYRWEWIGCWGIVMGTAIYVVATTMRVLDISSHALLLSSPTLLFFLYGLGRTLGRAIVLSLIDLEARRRVLTRTGEIPEVAVDE